MKKLTTILLCLFFSSALPAAPVNHATIKHDHPKPDSLVDMADYLAPYATKEKTDKLIEEDLKKHRCK